MRRALPRLWPALLLPALLFAPRLAGSVSCFDLCVVSSQNSTIEVDPSDGNGLDIWQVDGGFQVDYARWFWFRWGANGSGAPGAEKVLGDDASTGSGFTLTDAQADDATDVIDLSYSSNVGLAVNIQYKLVGGVPGSYSSNLSTRVSITNGGTVPLDVRWFHFVGMDVDLGGVDGNDTAVREASGAIEQSDVDSGSLIGFSSDRVPAAWAISPAFALSDDLEDGATTVLANGTSPTTANGVETAFEYHVFALAGGGGEWSYTATSISVPEPSGGALALAGLMVLAWLRRLSG